MFDIGKTISEAYDKVVDTLDNDLAKLKSAVCADTEPATATETHVASYETELIHKDIQAKLDEICVKYVNYPSYQHAAWIIEEEYREFCAELFKKDSEWDYTKIYKELIDIMAACYRTIIDRDLLSHIDNEEVK